MKKKDLILITGVLCIAIVAMLLFRFFTKPKDDSKTEIVVTIHGDEYGRYSIHEDEIVKIEADYGESILEIKDGKAKMLSAGCPDQICVNQSAIHYNHDMIVCMPNEIIVKVEGGQASDVDVITQ